MGQIEEPIKFKCRAVSEIDLVSEPGEVGARLKETRITFDITDNMDVSQYMTEDGLPLGPGIMPTTIAFIQGLICNIKYAHAQGYWHEAKHMQFVIDELQKGYVSANTELSTGTISVNKLK